MLVRFSETFAGLFLFFSITLDLEKTRKLHAHKPAIATAAIYSEGGTPNDQRQARGRMVEALNYNNLHARPYSRSRFGQHSTVGYLGLSERNSAGSESPNLLPEQVVGTEAAQVGLAHALISEVIDDPLFVVQVTVDTHQLILTSVWSRVNDGGNASATFYAAFDETFMRRRSDLTALRRNAKERTFFTQKNTHRGKMCPLSHTPLACVRLMTQHTYLHIVFTPIAALFVSDTV